MQKAFKIEGKDNPFPSLDHFCLQTTFVKQILQIILSISTSYIQYQGPAGNYMLKGNNRNTRTRCGVCSKLTIKIPGRCQWHLEGVFIVNFEHVSHLALQFLFLFYCINYQYYTLKGLPFYLVCIIMFKFKKKIVSGRLLLFSCNLETNFNERNVIMMMICFCGMADRRKAFTSYVLSGPLSKILTIANLRHAVSRV